MKNLLILFLSLILFSVSCGADAIMGGGGRRRNSYNSYRVSDNVNDDIVYSKSELAGTWNNPSGKPDTFRIDTNGNLKAQVSVSRTDSQGLIYSYTSSISGKIEEDTFKFPYTVKVTGNYNTSGTIRFDNPSNCYVDISIPSLGNNPNQRTYAKQ